MTAGKKPITGYDHDSGFWDRMTPACHGGLREAPLLAWLWRAAPPPPCPRGRLRRGVFTRVIAASGAEVSGCDCVEDAVARAQEYESDDSPRDQLPGRRHDGHGLRRRAFDLVFHVGSLIVSARDEIVRTLAETRRILASGGAMVSRSRTRPCTWRAACREAANHRGSATSRWSLG